MRTCFLARIVLRLVFGGCGIGFGIALGASPANTDAPPRPIRYFGLGEVRVLAISPDQRFLASAGQGGAFLWDIASSALLHRLEVTSSPTAVEFSPDGKFLFAGGRSTLRAWATADGSPVRDFDGHRGDINRLRITPDGLTLVSASSDNTVRLWSIESGRELNSIRVPGSPILDLAISPDGRRLATVDSFLTNCVRIWELASAAPISSLPTTNWPGQRCLFTPAGQLVTIAQDRSVLLWDPETGQVLRSYSGVTGSTTILNDLWMANDSTLAVVANDGTVYLWNLERSDPVRVVATAPVVASTGVPHEHLLITAELDSNLRIHQLPGGDTLRTFRGHSTSTHSGVAFSPDGRFVLSGGVEASTRLWDRRTGQPVRTFVGSPAGTAAAIFSADGTRVVTTVGLPSPGVHLWNTATGELEREFGWAKSWPTAVALSQDGLRLAAAAQDDRVRLFEVATGALKRTLSQSGGLSRLAFSSTAPLLLVGASDAHATLYNHESGQALHEFTANAGPVTFVGFSPGGETLLIGWQDGLVRFHDSFTLEVRREFVNPAAFLETAAMSPDGQYLLTGESFPFFTATLWDVAAAEPVRTFPGHRWTVSALAFSADGASILTGADLVREWSVADFAARLRITRLPEGLQLRWSSGQLEAAARPDGPWQPMPGTVSPRLVPNSGPSNFFRVRATVTE